MDMVTTTGVALTPIERAKVALMEPGYKRQAQELVERCKEIQPPTNKDGRMEVHARYMDLARCRIEIEKRGKDARADATALNKAIISVEKDLIAILSPAETRLRAMRDAYDAKVEEERQAQERAERDRVLAITTKISAMSYKIPSCMGLRASEIAAVMEEVQNTPILPDDYAEFVEQALSTKLNVLKELTDIHKARAEAEEAEAQRKREIEEQAAAAKAEREKLAEERKQLEAERAKQEEERKQIEAERAKLEAAEQRAHEERVASAAAALVSEIASASAVVDEVPAAEKVAAPAAPELTSCVDYLLPCYYAPAPDPAVPSALDIIGVIADYYKVDDLTALAWLESIDFQAARDLITEED